jgi:hypothetical protein
MIKTVFVYMYMFVHQISVNTPFKLLRILGIFFESQKYLIGFSQRNGRNKVLFERAVRVNKTSTLIWSIWIETYQKMYILLLEVENYITCHLTIYLRIYTQRTRYNCSSADVDFGLKRWELQSLKLSVIYRLLLN